MQQENTVYRRAYLVIMLVIWLNAGCWAGEGKTQTAKYIDCVAELNKLGTGRKR